MIERYRKLERESKQPERGRKIARNRVGFGILFKIIGQIMG